MLEDCKMTIDEFIEELKETLELENVKLNEDTNLVKIRNGDRCFTFKSSNYDGKTRTFNVPFNSQLWKKERTYESITDNEMKEIFIGSFTIEILGDWTRGYEVVGLDNVIIYS